MLTIKIKNYGMLSTRILTIRIKSYGMLRVVVNTDFNDQDSKFQIEKIKINYSNNEYVDLYLLEQENFNMDTV